MVSALPHWCRKCKIKTRAFGGYHLIWDQGKSTPRKCLGPIELVPEKEPDPDKARDGLKTL